MQDLLQNLKLLLCPFFVVNLLHYLVTLFEAMQYIIDSKNNKLPSGLSFEAMQYIIDSKNNKLPFGLSLLIR